MIIETERVYEAPRKKGAYRVLVDRLWPRGLRKDEVHVNLWLKEIAPSTELRKWFAHDPAKWNQFKRRFFHELESRQESVDQLIASAKGRPLVLLYGAKDTKHNQAVALKEYLEHRVL
jgi:uncharacterized protein YeaO (DUF488 family)